MPNVTFYISTGQMPSDERLAELSRGCVELCTSVLEAALETFKSSMSTFAMGTDIPSSRKSNIALSRFARLR